MKPDPKIRARSRPIRVAYILENGCDGYAWLDAIFAESFGRYGGRQSLIVPIENSVISKRYKEWLRFLDPDYVIMLTYDNKALVPELVDLLADTSIVDRERKRDQLEKHPWVRIDDIGLTSLSWLPYLMIVATGMHRVAPEFILDRYPSWVDDGFISDNFGTLNDSMNTFPLHQQIGVRGLILTPKDAPENRWHLGRIEGDEVQDGYDILDRLSKGINIVTLSQLSNINSQPYRSEHPWIHGFCLIVGDSFEDRVSFWNAELLFGDLQNQTFKTMRVPTAIISDEIRCGQIANFLRKCNWIGGSNKQAKIVVRSHSLSATDVQDLVELLRKTTMSYVEFIKIESTDDCIPLDTADIIPAYHFSYLQPAISEIAIRDVTTNLTMPEPLHLGYCTGAHPIFSQGCWFVDLGIDRLNDNSRFTNIRETWVLPIRKQLVRQLCSNTSARISRRGNISVQADISKRIVEVNQPKDSDIFFSILNEMQQFPYRDLRKTLVKPVAYKYSVLSDKGRYLQGMLGMFGSLSEFENILGKHFWRSQFERMVAPAQEQHLEVIRDLKLRMKATNDILQINDDDGWLKLAERIIQISSRLKAPRLKTCYAKLFDAWLVELQAAINSDENLKCRSEEILPEARGDLQRSLSLLLECGIFYRGHEWSCRYCSHRNWVDVELLKEIMRCEVCRKDHMLPIDVALDFRLNEFFATCLREYDTLTVAWALCALRQESKSCFIFVPQTALYRDYPEIQGSKPDRELDVCCIVDGQFVIGEVKAGVAKIAKRDIEDLASAAQELGADKAILMAFSGDPEQLDKKVQQLRLLLPENIKARGLVSEWDDAPSYYL